MNIKFSFIIYIVISTLFILLSSCNNEKVLPELVKTVSDPNFTIIPHTDKGFSSCNRKVVVFGIDIYAVANVDDKRLLHAANVMAQYLDNDEDGIIDNQIVLDKMIENKSYVVLWKTENDLNRINPPKEREGQDLGNDETHPNFVTNGKTGEFDASLEEALHIINNAGHSQAYPQAFGQFKGSELAKAMDIARGGQFFAIPDNYPSNAWYTYDDQTCEYENCQTIEYLYWAITSIMGAQENRLNEIDNEWVLNTEQKVKDTDKAIYSLLTNPIYKIPTILPDGTYRH